MAAGGTSCLVYVWDMKKTQMIRTFQGHRATVTCTQFDCADENLASGADDGRLLVHQIRASSLTCEVGSSVQGTDKAASSYPIRALSYAPNDRNRLAFAAGDGKVSMVDVSTGQVSARFEGNHVLAATGVAFSAANPSLLASAGMDKKIVFYDAKQHKSIKEILVQSPVQCLAYHWNGKILAVGTTSGDIHLYDLKTPDRPVFSEMGAHAPFPVYSLAFQNKPRDPNKSVNSSLSFSNSAKETPPRPPVKSQLQDIPKISMGGISPTTPDVTESKSNLELKRNISLSRGFQEPKQGSLRSGPPSVKKSLHELNSDEGSVKSLSTQGSYASLLPPDPPKDSHNKAEAVSNQSVLSDDRQADSLAPREGFSKVPGPEFMDTSGISSIKPVQQTKSNSFGSLPTPSINSQPSSPMYRQSQPSSAHQEIHRGHHGSGSEFLFGDYGSEGTSGFDKLLLEECLGDLMGSFRAGIQSDVKNLHLDMIRQFHIQQETLERTLKTHAEYVEKLVAENQDLRKQVEELRRVY